MHSSETAAQALTPQDVLKAKIASLDQVWNDLVAQEQDPANSAVRQRYSAAEHLIRATRMILDQDPQNPTAHNPGAYIQEKVNVALAHYGLEVVPKHLEPSDLAAVEVAPTPHTNG